MWGFGEICNGRLRGEEDFECLGAMGNGGLWGNGDYEGGVHWAKGGWGAMGTMIVGGCGQ